MNTIPFGLDIGATKIKVVSLMKEKETLMYNSALTAATPAKGMMSESPMDQQAIADTIKKLVNDAKITTPFVNIALPESQVYTRVISMPLLSEKELASAIYWEAEQYIPVPLPSVVLDYKVLRRPAPGQQLTTMDVLLVGAPTKLVNKYETVITLAGFSLFSIETEILSAIRSLVIPQKTEKGLQYPTTMIVHIGAISTSLAIVKDGVIVFAYNVATGGMALNRAIASDFGFTVTQAEEYKKLYGVSNTNLGGKLGEATTPILMVIITEIKKAIAFYNDKYKNESQIQQISLSGGTAKLPGIDMFFAENSGIETVIANPWGSIVAKDLPKEVVENAPDFSIAVGLAMRDYE